MKLLINKTKKKLYKDKIELDINTNEGIISKKDFNNNKKELLTHKKISFLKIKPNFKDLWNNIKRGPQIITLKDASFISAQLGLSQESKVLDTGGGSGAITCFFANLVGPKGHITCVEKQKRFVKIIQDNVKMFGFKNVEIVEKDIVDFKTKTVFDAVNLDLPSPWQALQILNKCLKNGGMLSVYVPNTTQINIMDNKISSSDFILENVYEIIQREWKVNDRICHPKFNMLGHTGFIMIYRKVKI